MWHYKTGRLLSGSSQGRAWREMATMVCVPLKISRALSVIEPRRSAIVVPLCGPNATSTPFHCSNRLHIGKRTLLLGPQCRWSAVIFPLHQRSTPTPPSAPSAPQHLPLTATSHRLDLTPPPSLSLSPQILITGGGPQSESASQLLTSKLPSRGRCKSRGWR